MTVLTPDVNSKVSSPQEEKKEAPGVQQQAEKQPEQLDPSQMATNAEKTEANEDPNWKAFREARKKDRSEREAAERRAAEKAAEATALKAALEATLSKGNPAPQQYQQDGYYSSGETEEEKIAKKVEEILARKEQQQRIEAAQREIAEAPVRLQQNFSDFDSVCAQENLDYLDYHFPEIAGPLSKLPQGYDKWAAIYQVIKKHVPNHANVKKDAAKADSNMQKPRSLSSTSITQSGEGTRQTWQDVEARRAANWARMQHTLKGV